MRTILLIFLAIFPLGLLTGAGESDFQESVQILLTTRGKLQFRVMYGDQTYVSLDSRGRILNADDRPEPCEECCNKHRPHHNDPWDDEYPEIVYYSGIHESMRGKPVSIGRIKIEYYHSIFEEIDGKIKCIGGVKVEYYRGISERLLGCPVQIDSQRISYGRSIDDAVNEKIDRIGNRKYSYHRGFSDDPMNGRLEKGERNFTVNGIRYRVRDVR